MDYQRPFLTVDIIIESQMGMVLIKRANPPEGWALPGGFVAYGESLEVAACREAKEETGLDITIIRQFHTYSDPDRDPRHHTVTTAYIATAKGMPRAADDARDVRFFRPDDLPEPIVFDHKKILEDYFMRRH